MPYNSHDHGMFSKKEHVHVVIHSMIVMFDHGCQPGWVLKAMLMLTTMVGFSGYN